MTCGAGDVFSQLAESSGARMSLDPYNIVSATGIVSSHAYSLLAAYEVNSKRGKVRLLKLRNPWGKTEWSGPWSDGSAEWDDDLKKQLNVQHKDDGIFFIEYKDFLAHFSDVQFCFIHDKYEYDHVKIRTRYNHAAYTKITVSAEGKYYFTVNQESKRKFATSVLDKYSSVSMVLARLNKTTNQVEYQHIDGNQRADREVWIKAKLTPGEYLIYTKVTWNHCEANDLVLSSYGPSKVTFEQVKKQDYPGFLELTFSSKARLSTKKATYAREGEADAYSVIELTKDGFIYSYYHNDSKRTLNIDVTYKEFKGLKLRKPNRGSIYSLKVQPGERKIVLVRVLPEQDVRQVMSERVRFTKPEEKAPQIPPNLIGKAPLETKITETPISKPIVRLDEERKVMESRRSFEKDAREKGRMDRLKKPNSNEYLDIYIYEYKHDNGIVFLYENKTTNYILSEKVEFVGKGLLLVEPASKGDIQFDLGPGLSYKLVFEKLEVNYTPRFRFHSKLKEIKFQ